MHCRYCGRTLTYGITTRDHILPKFIMTRARINNDSSRNIVLACGYCNNVKACNMMIPTIRNLKNFKYFTDEELKNYAEFLYRNKDKIYPALKHYSRNRETYKSELLEFSYFYKCGYFQNIGKYSIRS